MAQLAINAEARHESGKGAARRLRGQDKVPGVIYGREISENINLQFDAVPLQKLLQSEGAGGLVELNFDNQTQVALVKDVQRDPVLGDLLHVDFHAVALDKDVLVTVPIQLTGEDARENDGGVLAQALREVSVYCLPAAIPDSIRVDISGLGVGDSISVGEMSFPEGVRPETDPEESVASITLPTAEPIDPEEEELQGDEAAEATAGEEVDQEADEEE